MVIQTASNPAPAEPSGDLFEALSQTVGRPEEATPGLLREIPDGVSSQVFIEAFLQSLRQAAREEEAPEPRPAPRGTKGVPVTWMVARQDTAPPEVIRGVFDPAGTVLDRASGVVHRPGGIPDKDAMTAAGSEEPARVADDSPPLLANTPSLPASILPQPAEGASLPVIAAARLPEDSLPKDLPPGDLLPEKDSLPEKEEPAGNPQPPAENGPSLFTPAIIRQSLQSLLRNTRTESETPRTRELPAPSASAAAETKPSEKQPEAIAGDSVRRDSQSPAPPPPSSPEPETAGLTAPLPLEPAIVPVRPAESRTPRDGTLTRLEMPAIRPPSPRSTAAAELPWSPPRSPATAGTFGLPAGSIGSSPKPADLPRTDGATWLAFAARLQESGKTAALVPAPAAARTPPAPADASLPQPSFEPAAPRELLATGRPPAHGEGERAPAASRAQPAAQTPAAATAPVLTAAPAERPANRPSSLPAPPAPTSPTPVPETPQPTAPIVKELSIQLTDESSRNATVRVVERGGELHVAVRSSDGALASSLRGGLSDLVSRLESRDVRAEIWKPEISHLPASGSLVSTGDAQTPEGSAEQHRSPDGSSDEGAASYSQGDRSSQDGEGRSGQQRERPRWLEDLDEMFDTRSTANRRTGP